MDKTDSIGWARLLKLGRQLAEKSVGDRRRLLIAGVGAEAMTLGALHHLINLWGLPWDKQVLTVGILGPALGVLSTLALAPVWRNWLEIPRPRWLLFSAPAALVAVAFALALYAPPEIPHELTLESIPGAPAGEVRIREIRGAYGNAVPLSMFADLPGWELENGVLVRTVPTEATIRYAFRGPVGELTRISFVTSPDGGTIRIQLDGKRLDFSLRGVAGNETRARLRTGYYWRALDSLVAPFLLTVDALAIFVFLALLWVAHEIGQALRPPDPDPGAAKSRPRIPALLLICIIAFGLHAINFLSVPFGVSDDGESYIQGAVHWAAFHTLDGASSYRGPGITFLLAPALDISGRNPWGAKLVMHLVALACVPLLYWIGWQLTRRVWVAAAAALFAAVSPDLLSYSNFVLSEVPDIFIVMVFVTTLIPALRSPSRARTVITLLCGSMAVLVRPDNAVALVLATGAVGAMTLWPRIALGDASPGARAYTGLWSLAIAIAVAATPLLWWSAHNARVYDFFGISNYGGGVLYDGWIYFGESFGTRILDPDSPAVQKLDEAIPILARRGKGPPTSWQLYYRLLEMGYESNRAFSLLGEATTDSIRAHLPEAARILGVKARQTVRPAPTRASTVTSRNRSGIQEARTAKYFDAEKGLRPELGHIQDRINLVVDDVYAPANVVWFGWSGLMLWLSFYRRPPRLWMPLAMITVSALVLPIVVELANWRYMLPGYFIMTVIALAATDVLIASARHYLGSLKTEWLRMG